MEGATAVAVLFTVTVITVSRHSLFRHTLFFASYVCIMRLEELCLLLLIAVSAIAVAWASQAAGKETLLGIVGKDFILLGADSSVSQGVTLTASNLDKIAPLVDPRSYHAPQQQQQQHCIVAAAAGDPAMSDRLIGLLQAQATIREYEAGVGCDVRFVANVDDGRPEVVVEAGLTVRGMAHMARSQLSSIRPSANVCLLIAGMMYEERNSESLERPVVMPHQVQQQTRQAWKPVGVTEDEAHPWETVAESSASSSPSSRLRPHLYWLDELGSLQEIQYGAHGLGSNFCLSVLDQGFREDMTVEDASQLMQECFRQLRARFLINSPQPPCVKVVDAKGIRLIK